jgi:pimeloyl-ACP methyl ester carboxylesterase
MADPSRVTDELRDVRLKLYSDPAVQESLRSVFQNAFGGIGAPRKHVPEELLGEIRAPTLVLWTEKNPGTGPEVGRYISDRIPGARFASIDDAAHWPQWERPEVHDKIVSEFLLSPASAGQETAA